MKVLVACEFSGTVRDAFTARGHDAWSCDVLPSEKPGNHIQGDAREAIKGDWDLLIAHPPCTHLAVSGARWFPEKQVEQLQALEFFLSFLNALHIPMICVENPVSVVSSRICRPTQIIQPWQFGHGEVKATCLWLRNLCRLKPTRIVAGREQRSWKEAPGDDRWMRRSRTLPGVAEAMADQWGRPQRTGFGLACPARLKKSSRKK